MQGIRMLCISKAIPQTRINGQMIFLVLAQGLFKLTIRHYIPNEVLLLNN